MGKVRISDFHLVVVALSGGKGSQAMLDYLVCKAEEEGVPRNHLVALHTDMGEMDWPGTLDLAREHAAHYGVKFVAQPQGVDLVDMAVDYGVWSPPTIRICTLKAKTGPSDAAIKKMRLPPKTDGPIKFPVRIAHCLGNRQGSSSVKRKPLHLAKAPTSSRRQVYRWYPILDWSEKDVWDRVHLAGTRHHYAYDLGLPRLECAFCVRAPRAAHLVAGEHNPELLSRYVEAEKSIGPFQKSQSLAEVADALRRGERAGKVPDWDM